MAEPYPEVEARISKAIELIPTREKFTIPKLAKEFNVPEQRLRRRLKGVPSKTQQIPVNRKLSEAGEAAVCGYLDQLDKLGLPVRPAMLQNAANVVLSHNHTGDDDPPVVGTLWVHRFLKRHPEYFVQKQKTTDP